ncbi:MAG TPA: glycosyltransferase family 4 protein [Kofleriaceae bacterium]|nr:glycosyltransferase family 4 protein [Kofleriaceae bacterium]
MQLRHVIKALTPHHSVDLLVVREGEQAYVERQGSVRVLRVPTHEADVRAQIQAFQRALKRQLEGAEYDVVHCRDAWSGIPVLEARDRLGYAVVYDLARAPLGESLLDPDLDAQYGRDEEACLLAADMVLAPTPAAVKALAGRGKPERVVLSPPGVDVDRFDWDEATKSGPPRILYAGSVDPGRGVRVIIRAMAAIVREVDARLVIAGPVISPKFEQALRDGIRELGLSDKVDLAGPVDHDQLPALIATASVCVVPAAADLTPNPTTIFPTKLLEYMACKRAVVAPRRETVSMVVENNREALLFEPGDPIDLARKVLRLIGEPALRDKIAAAGYDRVRREWTASAARRAIRNAYETLAEKLGGLADEPVDDEAPKVEILSDDDFEATVFEEAPRSVAVDTALNRMEIEVDDAGGHTSSEQIAAPPPPDETQERAAVPPGPRDQESGAWTVSALSSPPPSPHDDWVVTNVSAAVRSLDDEAAVEETAAHDGTPVEVTPAPALSENSFVAGEIDVPTPAPLMRPTDKTPAVEFTAASSLLGSPEPADPDTGSRTPPIEIENRKPLPNRS